MSHATIGEGDSGLSKGAPAIPIGESRESLALKIYRDIGLAAVASELEMPVNSLEPDLGAAVRRGARYIDFLLKSRAAGLQAAN
jgi:hypothetical protein